MVLHWMQVYFLNLAQLRRTNRHRNECKKKDGQPTKAMNNYRACQAQTGTISGLNLLKRNGRFNTFNLPCLRKPRRLLQSDHAH